MRGKGFSTCLLCESEKDLLLGSTLVVKVIKHRYSTDTFDLMLGNSKVCMTCIGRVQQLDDFCALNETMDEKDLSGEKCCDICRRAVSTNKVIPSNDSIIEEIKRIEWLKNLEENDEFVCCYSCFNFTLLYNATKEKLTELLDYYYTALKNCKIIITDCGNNVEINNLDSILQDQFFGSLSLAPVVNSNETDRPRQSIVRFISEPEIILIPESNHSLIPEPIAEDEADTPDFGISNENVQVVPEPVTRKLRNSTGSARVVPEPVTRKLRNSNESARVLSKIESNTKPRKTRHSTGVLSKSEVNFKRNKLRHSTDSKPDVSNFKNLKKKHNILECRVMLERLQIKSPEKTDSNKKKNNSKSKAIKTLKIKLNAKSKMTRRQMKRLESNIKDESLELEVVLAGTDIAENNNNSQGSTIPLRDPLNASASSDCVFTENDTSSLIKYEANNNEVTANGNDAKKPTPKKRKANVRKTPAKKRKYSSPKNEVSLPESSEIHNEKTDTNEAAEDLPSSEESDTAIEEPYLSESTEIVFLHPMYNNKVLFESTSRDEFSGLLSTSQEQENEIEPSTDDTNFYMNVEYLEESLEEILNTRPSPPQQDSLCPIYTMDELLNEDSLLSKT